MPIAQVHQNSHEADSEGTDPQSEQRVIQLAQSHLKKN